VAGLLLIRGLGHSGSTILDLALGAHPAMVGLGEAVRLLHKPRPGEEHRGPAQLRGDLRHSRRCTCGALACDCPVWGPMLEWLPAHDDLPLVEKLQRLSGQLAGLAGAPTIRWVVDSFQDDLELPQLQVEGLEIRVIFLVRDARSWVHGRCRHGGGGPLKTWRTLARWLRINRRFEHRLGQCRKPLFRLGYEELALAPEAALGRLCDWLDLPFDPDMVTPGETSKSHILAGNRMRFDPRKRARIRYDGGWLASGLLASRLAPLLPPVQAMHRRLVYSNKLL
jgi:hypothetical protein